MTFTNGALIACVDVGKGREQGRGSFEEKRSFSRANVSIFRLKNVQRGAEAEMQVVSVI